MQKTELDYIDISPDISLAHMGPSLQSGPLPSVFYFSLSAKDSLCKDPFNQPIQFLSTYPIRCFSLTLPFHENNVDPKDLIKSWAGSIEKNIDFVSPFIDKIKKAIVYTISHNLSIPSKIAIMGLSRGAFLALHAAAVIPEIQWVLGYAPLLDLEYIEEFQSITDNVLLKNLSSKKLIPALINKNIRFYIGNRDSRVSTRKCFSFIEEATEESYKRNKKVANTDLIISPSIGHKGHGTNKQTFEDGALWLKDNLLPLGHEL